MRSKTTLIFGTGNDILTDDGIGIRITEDLERLLHGRDISFRTAGCGGLEIIEYIKDYELVIFIDGIRTGGGIPGEVYHFRPKDFRETTHLSNLHDISFLTALKLARSINLSLPEEIHIIAIEIIEDMTFSEEFTPLIREKYPMILDKVFGIVTAITGR